MSPFGSCRNDSGMAERSRQQMVFKHYTEHWGLEMAKDNRGRKQIGEKGIEILGPKTHLCHH